MGQNNNLIKISSAENPMEVLTEILERQYHKNKSSLKKVDYRKQLDFILALNPDSTTVAEKINIVRILIESYNNSSDKSYLGHLKSFVNQQRVDEILGGHLKNHSLSHGKSGWVLILLYAYSSLEEEWMHIYIRNMASYFLSGLFPWRKKGMIYLSGEDGMLPKCGLEDGNSGMALVFLELGHFFKNEEYIRIAQQLILAEDLLLTAPSKNGSIGYQNTTSFEAYKSVKESYLSKDDKKSALDMSDHSFSRGLLGISCVRLKAFNYTKNEAYLLHFNRLLKTLNTAKDQNYSYKKEDSNLLKKLNTDKQAALAFVFQEIAACPTEADITLISIVKKYFRLPYAYTLKTAHALGLNVVEGFCHTYDAKAFSKEDLFKAFYQNVKSVLKKSELPGAQQLTEILKLEYQKIKLRKSVKDPVLVMVNDLEQFEHRDQLLTLEEAEFWNTELLLNKHCLLVQTQWQWVVDEIELFHNRFDPLLNLHQEVSVHYAILQANSHYDTRRKTNIHEKPLTEYQYVILDLFEYPVTVAEVFKEFQQLFEIQSKTELQSVRNIFLRIVRDGVFDGYLVGA